MLLVRMCAPYGESDNKQHYAEYRCKSLGHRCCIQLECELVRQAELLPQQILLNFRPLNARQPEYDEWEVQKIPVNRRQRLFERGLLIEKTC